MPVIQITMLQGRTADQKRKIAKRVTDALVEEAGAKREGITEYDKLPKQAREYLSFVARESEAKIGMISTGPDRDHTILLDEFTSELKQAAKKA